MSSRPRTSTPGGARRGSPPTRRCARTARSTWTPPRWAARPPRGRQPSGVASRRRRQWGRRPTLARA
eukprot:2039799-Pyramimonas_sp.AAC.1